MYSRCVHSVIIVGVNIKINNLDIIRVVSLEILYPLIMNCFITTPKPLRMCPLSSLLLFYSFLFLFISFSLK